MISSHVTSYTFNYDCISEGIEFGNELFFNAYSSLYGESLWKTDGTIEGTVMIKDTHTSSTYYHHT